MQEGSSFLAECLRQHPAEQDPEFSINLSSCQYPEVAEVARHLGWTVCTEKGDRGWDIYWADAPPPREMLGSLEGHQRVNHFPGMHLLGRKNLLARGLNRLKKRCPEDWRFVPETWMLPFQAMEMLK